MALPPGECLRVSSLEPADDCSGISYDGVSPHEVEDGQGMCCQVLRDGDGGLDRVGFNGPSPPVVQMGS